MKLKALKKFETKEYELSRVITWMKEFLDQFMANQFIRGELLEATITTSGLAINHGMGETPSGWYLVDKTADARVWRTAWDNKTITLQSSATVSVKVWVF